MYNWIYIKCNVEYTRVEDPRCMQSHVCGLYVYIYNIIMYIYIYIYKPLTY